MKNRTTVRHGTLEKLYGTEWIGNENIVFRSRDAIDSPCADGM